MALVSEICDLKYNLYVYSSQRQKNSKDPNKQTGRQADRQTDKHYN